jgi:hypothetical protein
MGKLGFKEMVDAAKFVHKLSVEEKKMFFSNPNKFMKLRDFETRLMISGIPKENIKQIGKIFWNLPQRMWDQFIRMILIMGIDKFLEIAELIGEHYEKKG